MSPEVSLSCSTGSKRSAQRWCLLPEVRSAGEFVGGLFSKTKSLQNRLHFGTKISIYTINYL